LAAATILGVFSKESGVMILPVIILYELILGGQPVRRSVMWLSSVATLFPLAAMLMMRASVLAASPPAEFPFTDNPIAGADLWIGRLTAVKVIAGYLWTTAFPWKLSCDYSWHAIPLVRNTPADWFLCVSVFVIVAATMWSLRRNRVCFFLAVFAFLNFLPASNLLFPTGTIRADRLLYLPAFGLLGCAVVIASAVPRKCLALSMGCAVAACFAARTYARNMDWQSELTIATSDVAASPNSFKVHQLLASSLFEADPSHLNIDRVIDEQNRSLDLLDPLPDVSNRPDAYRIAGYYLLVKGRKTGPAGHEELYRRAINDLLRCVRIDAAGRKAYQAKASRSELSGADAEAYLLLSVAYLDSGDAQRALEPVERSIAFDPFDPRGYRQLSAVLFTQGQRDDSRAVGELEDALTALQDTGLEKGSRAERQRDGEFRQEILGCRLH
jgi:tetratricopeptide (TPR) repeat protein